MATKKLRRMLALFLTASIAVGLITVGSFAAGEDGETVALESVQLPGELPVAYGTELDAALSQLPSTLVGTVEKAGEPAEGEEPDEVEPTSDVNVPVTWSCDNYDGWTAGAYTFTATLGEGYVYEGTAPLTVQVEVNNPAGAKINETAYDTLDAAIQAAAEGDTIVLLGNCTTTGMNLQTSLTIQSEEGQHYTVNFVDKGIALWGKALTFRNCDVLMDGVGSTPYAEWTWMSISASKDASLTLDNVNMTMDAEETTNSPHAIYFCSNNRLNLENGTVLTIRNYANDALEWDGGDGGYNVNITNSTYISDHNRSGFTGIFYTTVENGNVQVINSTGNGSNGSHFIFKDSEVDFSNNGSHGLSTGDLTVENSRVTAKNNAYIGIAVGGTMSVSDHSVLTITGNAAESLGYAAMRLYNDYTFSVDGTSELYINDNYNTGLYVRQGNLTVADGAVLEIMGNQVTNNQLGGYGGGLYVGYGANYDPTVVIPADAKIYNNHATAGGDDIYVSEGVNGPSLTFGAVGADWALDGDPDCTDAIDGWYQDSADNRWSAHRAPLYALEFDRFERNGLTTVTGALALKAAHGLVPVDPGDPEAPEWEISKSKTATNLDANYESQVTLALPAAGYERTMDVVLVIDDTHAGSVIFEDAVNSLLDELAGKPTLDIKVGVVAFDAVSRD